MTAPGGRVAQLRRRIARLAGALDSAREERDWHGVIAFAVDIREAEYAPPRRRLFTPRRWRRP